MNGSEHFRNHQANGMGGRWVGGPDAVAQDMARLAALGLKGIAVSFVNYLVAVLLRRSAAASGAGGASRAAGQRGGPCSGLGVGDREARTNR